MKKKILFLIPTLGHGGAEKVLVNLVNNLDKSKFDITVQTIFDDGVNKDFLKKHIRYIYTMKKTFRGFSHLLKLITPKQLHRMLIKETYDIEVAFLEAVCTRIISGCNNQNTVLISWVHCTMHDKKEASIGYRDWDESVNAYNQFDRIVCVSRAVETEFNVLYGMESKTTYVYNINESDQIRSLCQIKSSETDIIDSDSFNICAVGKVIEVKGFDRLARIQKRLVDNNYHTHVYILGVGNKQPEINDFITKAGLQNSWTFLGYRNNPYEWMAKCDLFVCSSRSEGLSTAVTEALLVGIPVITTDVSGMKELLENGRSGIIVDNDEDALYEGIKTIIDDTSLHSKLRQEAQRRGEDFQKEKIISDVENVLLSFGGMYADN